MSVLGTSVERQENPVGGSQLFIIEELGRLARHFISLIFVSKCTEPFSSFQSAFQIIVMNSQLQLVPNFKETFTKFEKMSKESLKRAWTDYNYLHLKNLYNLISQNDQRKVGGSLDGINTYYPEIPSIGPVRIGGPNDPQFSSIFSMKSMYVVSSFCCSIAVYSVVLYARCYNH